LVLAVGLIVGIILGVVYWAVSPVIFEGMEWPPVSFVEPPPVQYRSTITLGVAGGSEPFDSMRDLQAETERQEANLNSFSFLEFLAGEVADQAPEYQLDVADLDTMIAASYDQREDERPKIDVQVDSENPEMSYFLASSIASFFESYRLQQEAEIEQSTLQESQQEIDAARSDLLEARQELADINLRIAAYDLNTNPEYLAAKSKYDALLAQLDVESTSLAEAASEGDAGSLEYQQTETRIRNLSTALAEARIPVAQMEAQANTNLFEANTDYTVVDSRIRALETRLSELSRTVALASGNETIGAEGRGLVAIGVASTPINLSDPPPATTPEKVSGRTALLIGGLAGLVLAWLALNRKWVAARLGLSSKIAPEGPEEDNEEDEDADEEEDEE